MTETHSLGEWGEFCERYQLKELLGSKRMLMLEGYNRSALLAQKEGFRREIVGLRPDYIQSWHDAKADRAELDGYNNALDDLLTKLDTNLVEMPGGAGNRFKSAFGGRGGVG